jgi:hypothetical protein
VQYTVTLTVLFDATFETAQLSNTSNGDLVLSSSAESVTEGWFQSNDCQHPLVQSVDGVTFKLSTQ